MASSVIRGISLSFMPSSASDREAEPTGELPQLPRRVCRAAQRPRTARRSRREWPAGRSPTRAAGRRCGSARAAVPECGRGCVAELVVQRHRRGSADRPARPGAVKGVGAASSSDPSATTQGSAPVSARTAPAAISDTIGAASGASRPSTACAIAFIPLVADSCGSRETVSSGSYRTLLGRTRASRPCSSAIALPGRSPIRRRPPSHPRPARRRRPASGGRARPARASAPWPGHRRSGGPARRRSRARCRRPGGQSTSTRRSPSSATSSGSDASTPAPKRTRRGSAS